jgi:hypothetical protein
LLGIFEFRTRCCTKAGRWLTVMGIVIANATCLSYEELRCAFKGTRDDPAGVGVYPIGGEP